MLAENYHRLNLYLITDIREYQLINQSVMWQSKREADHKNIWRFIMNNTITAIKNRIHLLEMRDPVVNHNIINKLKRKLRKLEG